MMLGSETMPGVVVLLEVVDEREVGEAAPGRDQFHRGGEAACITATSEANRCR